MGSHLEDLLDEQREEGAAEGAAEVIRRVRRQPVRVTQLPEAPPLESSPEWRAGRMSQAMDDLMNDRGVE